MIGKYRFIQDGAVVAESENLITTEGRRVIIDSISGNLPSKWVSSLAVGVGATAAAAADVTLDFEVARVDVSVSTPDYVNESVVYKADLPLLSEFVAYEAGAYYSDAEVLAGDSFLILNVDQDYDNWSAGTYNATNSRMGEALRLTATTSGTTTSDLAVNGLDLSQYSNADEFLIALYSSGNTANVKIQFRTDASNYFEITATSPSSGYGIYSVTKGAATETGTGDWSNIQTIRLSITATGGGSTTVDFDGLRVEDVDSRRDDNILVSRSVLGTQVTKVAGIPMTMEYEITI